ncbi:MAG: hypothetical protein ACI4RV_09525, partial [Eubacteriales bacterium]
EEAKSRDENGKTDSVATLRIHFFLCFAVFSPRLLTFSCKRVILLSKEDLPLTVARRLYSWGLTCGRFSFFQFTAARLHFLMLFVSQTISTM